MDKEKVVDELYKILLKKASGFYYEEECLEYVYEAPKKPSASKTQLTFFDSLQPLSIGGERLNSVKNNQDGIGRVDSKFLPSGDNGLVFSDGDLLNAKNELNNDFKQDLKNNLKTCPEPVTEPIVISKSGVKCGQKRAKKIKGDNGSAEISYAAQPSVLNAQNCDNENKQPLTLSKKKVTTHYVPPDMLAIKMLLENYSQVNSGGLDSKSDKELLELANSLRAELGL